MKKILVVGGAGYIGSYMCKQLSKKGYEPIVLDNLSRGYRQAVPWGTFVEGDMADEALLDRIFSEHDISAVMHFAGYINVGESVTAPALYYQNNVGATLSLLQSMVTHGVGNFVFSSTAAVYGEPVETPISEDHPCSPVNPYGKSKLMVEQILEDFSEAYDFRYVSLRYFNAAGADPDAELGEAHEPETHLIPLVLKAALGQIDAVSVFGTDYPTKDGTCIRDYIHIHDLVKAHLLAVDYLDAGRSSAAYNLGNGAGYSVMEVIDTARRVTEADMEIKVAKRRAGDAAVLVASSKKAQRELGWKPNYISLSDIIESAWKWHRMHPRGYLSNS